MKEKNTKKGEDSIITIEEIQRILLDYRIGKKPLAKLLGWGETTIIRYIDGDIPTNEYSDKLKALINNPCYYYDILLKNKDCLTGVAFRKSKKAVLSKIMDSKINVISQYIINKYEGETSPGYVQLLLYYVQGFSLAIYGKEMFPDEYSLNYSNMPYSKLYEDLKARGINCVELEEDVISREDRNLIDKVLESFEWYGLKALDTMSNNEKALLKISRDKSNNKIVAKETIKSFFNEILVQYEIHGINEINKYPDKRIVDIKNLT